MVNYIYKLNFTSALHIGNDLGTDNLASSECTIHSDTIFSSLCIEALNCGGQECLDKLVDYFNNNQAVISDAFPFKDDIYFLPKPLYRETSKNPKFDPKDRKVYKKLSFISASMYKSYIANTKDFDIQDALEKQKDIFFPFKRECAAVSRKEETEPYFVGGVSFNKNCGLYIIMSFANDSVKDFMESLLKSLAFSGIGGKRSVGMGQFKLRDSVEISTADKELNTMLNNQDADFYITLNTSLPTDEDLGIAMGKESKYAICRRGGFVQSSTYSNTQLKKKTIYAFAPGSYFKNKYQGKIHNVSCKVRHPVYKYLKPMFAGVKL